MTRLFNQFVEWLALRRNPQLPANARTTKIIVTSFPAGANQSVKKWIEEYAVFIDDSHSAGIKFYLPTPLAFSIGMDDHIVDNSFNIIDAEYDKPFDLMVVEYVLGTTIGKYQICGARLKVSRGEHIGLRCIEVMGEMTPLSV